MVSSTFQHFSSTNAVVVISMEDLRLLDDDTNSIAIHPKTPTQRYQLSGPAGCTPPLLPSYALHLPITLATLRRCNLYEQMQIASSNTTNNKIVKDYLHNRLKLIGEAWFDNGDTLLEILRSCNALISGDVVLQFLLPQTGSRWYPLHLDIYVSMAYRTSMYRLLEMQGYHNINERVPSYWLQSYSTIARLATFARGSRIIKITTSTSTVPCPPIFELENTALMNLISHDRIYCAYPTLTFRGMAIINPGPLYTSSFCTSNMQTLLRYRQRGFVYTNCHRNTNICVPCPSVTRSLADANGVWWDFTEMVQVHDCPRDIFNTFGIIDCHWTLGGPICGCPQTLVLPEVRVVENESYVLSMYPPYLTLNIRATDFFILDINS